MALPGNSNLLKYRDKLGISREQPPNFWGARLGAHKRRPVKKITSDLPSFSYTSKTVPQVVPPIGNPQHANAGRIWLATGARRHRAGAGRCPPDEGWVQHTVHLGFQPGQGSRMEL